MNRVWNNQIEFFAFSLHALGQTHLVEETFGSAQSAKVTIDTCIAEVCKYIFVYEQSCHDTTLGETQLWRNIIRFELC